MRIISLILILLSFNVWCSEEKTPIPNSWLDKKVPLEHIHKQLYDFCVTLQKRLPLADDKCEKGSGNVFEHPLVSPYIIYSFRSPNSTWEQIAGMAGYALVINGKIVEIKVTSVN